MDSRLRGNRGEGEAASLPHHCRPTFVLSPVRPHLRHFRVSASISPALKKAQAPGVDSMESPLPWMPVERKTSGLASGREAGTHLNREVRKWIT